MTGRYCEECLMPHDTCEKCGALVVASVTLHRTVNAHGSGPHWCGQDNPRYLAALEAMRQDYDESRDMLTDCKTCGQDVIRRANSPVLYDVHGYYGLLGDTAVHNCVPAPVAPPPPEPTLKEGGDVPGLVPAMSPKPWRVIP